MRRRIIVAILLTSFIANVLTPAAAPRVVQRKATAPPSRVKATFCMIFEDSQADIWDAIKAGVFDGFPIGISVIPNRLLRADTTNLALSVYECRAAMKRGHEIVSGGHNEPASLFHGTTGDVAQGDFTNYNAFRQEIIGGFLGIRDTLLLGTPRIHSWSNSSATQELKAIVAEVFEYATVGDQTATSHATRPIEWYPLRTLNHGTAQNTGISLTYGIVGDPFEIEQSMSEQNSMAQCQAFIRRAVQTKGLNVLLAHEPNDWNAGLGGGADYSSLRAFLSWMKTNYIDTGLLQVLRPSDAFDLYYNTPLSPTANMIPDDFADIDGNGAVDFMFSGSGSTITAPQIVVSPTGGYAGGAVATLNWAGAGTGGSFWEGVTGDQAWEAGRCQWQVYNRKGMAVRFEIFAQIDPGVDATYVGERIGVTFGGPFERIWNRWGGSSALVWANSSVAEYVSITTADALEPPTFVFAANDVVGTKWVHVVASWPTPPRSDYVFINLWKTAGLDANAVRISKPRVTFYPYVPPLTQLYTTRP